MEEYLIAVGVIFAINLMPAFGPPTWSVLVFFTFNSDLNGFILVPLGAIAAASGRYLLAVAARAGRTKLSPKRREGLEAAHDFLLESRGRAGLGLGLFALSPVPSAQLFIAAGLLRVPLVPLTLAFFSGRLVSYSIYVGAASAAGAGLEALFEDSLTSPVGIAIQVLMLAGLVALVRIDWVAVLGRFEARHTGKNDRTGGERWAVTTEAESSSSPDDGQPRET